jgi:hypothetical protein
MGPSLEQVLSTGSHSASPVNFLFLAAGLIASLVAAVSVAKGVEVFKRRSALPAVGGKRPCLEDSHYQEKTAKLSFMLDELKLEKESVVEQNHELRNQLTSLSGALYTLKAEKEKLALQVSEPPVQAGVVKAKAKNKIKPRIKTVNKKKEAAGRKPPRVSRKKK